MQLTVTYSASDSLNPWFALLLFLKINLLFKPFNNCYPNNNPSWVFFFFFFNFRLLSPHNPGEFVYLLFMLFILSVDFSMGSRLGVTRMRIFPSSKNSSSSTRLTLIQFDFYCFWFDIDAPGLILITFDWICGFFF